MRARSFFGLSGVRRLWQKFKRNEVGQALSADHRDPHVRIVNLSSGAIAGFTFLSAAVDSMAGLYDFARFDLIFALVTLVPIGLNRAQLPRAASYFLLVVVHIGALCVSPVPGAKEPQGTVYAVLLLLTFILLHNRSWLQQGAGALAVPFSYFLVHPLVAKAEMRNSIRLTEWQADYAQIMLVVGSFLVASLILFVIFRINPLIRRLKKRGAFRREPGKWFAHALALYFRHQP